MAVGNIWIYVAIVVLIVQLSAGHRLSKKKCWEYREQTIWRAQLTQLISGGQHVTVEKLNCSKTINLIYGGENALPGEFPHQAVLGWRTENPAEYAFLCGGTLISERFVLTAAHCFRDSNPFIVRLGEDNLKVYSDNQDDYEIEEIISHPEYRFARAYNDIALIKLAEDVTFSRYVRPACLWDDYIMNVTSVMATGFGQTSRADNSDVLQKVQLDFVDTAVCEEQYRGVRKFKEGISRNQLCVGSHRGEGYDTCHGDSGGPVQVVTETEACTYHVLGITSTGTACGIGAAVYTRVAGYIDWIEDIVWKNNK